MHVLPPSLIATALSEACCLARYLILLLLLVTAATAFFFRGPAPTLAGPAENFRLYNSRGIAVSLDQYRGKIIVLDFYASWASACARSGPEMQRLYETYKTRGVIILGVNVNDTANPHEYAARMGLNYPILVGGDMVAKTYGINEVPGFVVISPTGQVIHRSTGWNPKTLATITDLIEKNLPNVRRHQKR